jgi:hypothetical protein
LATMRWRPAAAQGSRGARRTGQRGGKGDQGPGEDDAWNHGKQEVDDGDLHSGGRRGKLHRRQSRRAEEQGAEGVQRKKKRGRRSGGLFRENQKLQGLHRKEGFPTDLGVFCEKAQNESCRVFQALQFSFKAQLQELKVCSITC